MSHTETSSARRPRAFYEEYPMFAGELLEAISDSLHHEDIQPAIIHPELAGLWVAAGAVMGVHQLLSIIQKFQGLQTLLQGQVSNILGEKSDNHQAEEKLALGIGILLHRFSANLKKSPEEQELQEKYTSYLERVERTFLGLQEERKNESITSSEHQKEVEALYLQSFYMLTRLQRM